jgi:hypothetical protein
MQPARSSIWRHRLLRPALLILAVAVFAVVCLGMGDVVRAAFQPAPQVQPYDPLPRW